MGIERVEWKSEEFWELAMRGYHTVSIDSNGIATMIYMGDISIHDSFRARKQTVEVS